jgi:hypothetical protein
MSEEMKQSEVSEAPIVDQIEEQPKEIVTAPIDVKPSKFKRFMRYCFPPKNTQENIFQYILRQFYLTDSKGNPSLTSTLVAYVMILVGIVSLVEIKNAQLHDKVNGFSDMFMYLIIILSALLTREYRNRQKTITETSDQVTEQVPGFIEKIVDIIKSKVGMK